MVCRSSQMLATICPRIHMTALRFEQGVIVQSGIKTQDAEIA
jgi:hypothetical protein